jgi:CubicO group peptidase (beta-lactamase class C family)
MALGRAKARATVGYRLLRLVLQAAACLIAGWLLSACSSESSNHPEWVPYDSNPNGASYDFSEVDSVVEDFLEENPDIEGATLAVVRRGESQIYERAYGAFERDRVSLIASTGKVLSAGVILSLADEGLLDLDRDEAEYLDWGDHHPGVTIRNILSMMSGIPSANSGAFEDWYVDPCVYDPDVTLEECARSVYQFKDDSVPPGQEFRYSAGAWQVAGAVAEAVAGASWEELVQKKLASRCALQSTGYTNIRTNDYPSDFDGDPESLPETANPYLGGGAYSTATDYSKVLLMHLHEGVCDDARVLSQTSVQAMREDLVPEGTAMPIWRDEAVNYGIGWWKYEDEPTLLIDPGAFGARAYLDPVEGWGAIAILEAHTTDGAELRQTLVPAIRAALEGAAP